MNTKNENEINTENILISVLTTNTLNTNHKNNYQIEMNAKNVSISDPCETPSIKECLNTIKSGSSPPVSFNQHLSTKIIQDKFNNIMYN